MSITTQSPEVQVPPTLRRPHPFVATTRDAARSARTDEQGRLQLGGAEDVARVTVSRPQLHRALLIIQALFVEAERRGFDVKVARDSWNKGGCVAIVIQGHAYPVGISEMTDRVPMTDQELERWRTENKWRLSYATPPTNKSVVNGRLMMSLPRNYDGRQSNWTEGPRGSLEGKLGAVFTELELRAEADDQIAAERVRAEEERQRRLEEQMERERLARIEDARAKRLFADVTSWRYADEVREYLTTLRKRATEVAEEERKRLEQWCDWAEAWVERSDPMVNTALIAGIEPSSGARPPNRFGDD